MHLDLGQLVGFLAWLERAGHALRVGLPLPDVPPLDDPTLRRWAERLVARDQAVRADDGKAKDLDAAADELATQVGDLSLFAAEHLAVAYEVAGQATHAQQLRLRAAALTIRRASA